MLFNSFQFLLIFLPISFIVWHILKINVNIRFAIAWISFSSLFFYSFWNVQYLFLLLFSIAINFFIGKQILLNKSNYPRLSKKWMIAGVSFNLLVLAGFKYLFFFASTISNLLDVTSPIDPIILPLAISFVTFQKIAYLVDCERGLVENHHFIDYLFFVSFFPQLIAGPIVHHRPLISQINSIQNPLFKDHNAIIAGLSFLGIGLFKKIIIADSLATYASPVFNLAMNTVPSSEASWQAMFAYTLQLYFDFSGYSDMAIGLALLFGFKLPINFLSPYKSLSIIDFWRHWHITLSTFLRDYLYIPLGGNRNGKWLRMRNVWITMVLAGVWHGAGWTFLWWGILHGTLLLLNQIWQRFAYTQKKCLVLKHSFFSPFKILCTFLLVSFAWVLFRSADLSAALNMYSAIFNFSFEARLPTPDLNSVAIFFENFLRLSSNMGWIWIAIGLFIVMLLPSSSQLLSYDPAPNTSYKRQFGFVHGVFIGGCFWCVFKWMLTQPATEFLYFNF